VTSLFPGRRDAFDPADGFSILPQGFPAHLNRFQAQFRDREAQRAWFLGERSA